jgi:glycerol-3-phosphate dehydrogenase
VADDFDIAVIGGGINGAGIARDAALRGLRVLLLEKNDFGSGTSSWSSRLIHGGLRYLEHGEIPLVYESLRERRLLRRLAPHLVDKLLISIPVYRGSRRGRFIIRLGMIAYDLLSIGKEVPRHRMLNREEMIAAEPGLLRDGLVGGARYYDSQVNFAERLVLDNVLSASEAGALVKNYSPVIGINVRHGAVEGLHYFDGEAGTEQEVRARVIINAAGPWVDRVLATVNRELPRFMGGTKGSHIIVGGFEGAPSSAFYVEARRDGRPFFIIPWNGQYLIGTTDIRYDGDPGDVVAGPNEIRYLLDETNRVFPAAALTESDIHFAYAGVRPLPRSDKGPESAITRRHIIHRHRKEASGLISIIGGKLTTYRSLAEQAVDVAVHGAGIRSGACRTRSVPLPGAADLDAVTPQVRSAVTPACAQRLLAIYGSRAAAILELHREGGASTYLDEGRTVLAAEVAHAVRSEFAVSLVDIVHRRIMTGLAPDQGASIAQATAKAAAVAAGWDDRETASQLAALAAYNRRFQSFRDA